MDVGYDEISEALATTPATSMRVSSHIRSTQCGRVLHEDDWTIMFANLQGAAGYLGFDLTAGSR